MNKLKIIFLTFFIITSFLLVSDFSTAQTNQTSSVCAVYFTGVGCPHCAKTDPIILENLLKEYPNLIIIEYEIYQQKENASLIQKYNENYNSGLGIPSVIFNKKEHIAGDRSIINNIKGIIEKSKGNPCPLINGNAQNFEDLNLVDLPGKPKIWTKDRILTKTNKQTLIEKDFTLPKILSLAVVDAINPCALAVLTLMLISILTYNPKEKKNILLAGLSFTLSVFIMYLIYGLIIVKSFQFIQALTFVRLWLYKILGVGAIILGFLNLKDFIWYKPGGFLTEMPIFLRPKVKKIISGITSPKGAFIIGAFVTIFLLPCTIGPYVIAGGILCSFKFLKIVPYLFLYNLIFILPMLAITLIVYLGIGKVEDVSGWKAKNIRYLHLITGFIILGLGIVIILGLI